MRYSFPRRSYRSLLIVAALALAGCSHRLRFDPSEAHRRVEFEERLQAVVEPLGFSERFGEERMYGSGDSGIPRCDRVTDHRLFMKVLPGRNYNRVMVHTYGCDDHFQVGIVIDKSGEAARAVRDALRAEFGPEIQAGSAEFWTKFQPSLR